VLNIAIAVAAIQRLAAGAHRVRGLPVVSAIAAAVILGTGGWYWLDPAVALLIAVIVGYHAARLVRRILTALRSRAGTSARQ
jgi:Co/Zn/Cd efflux system component